MRSKTAARAATAAFLALFAVSAVVHDRLLALTPWAKPEAQQPDAAAD